MSVMWNISLIRRLPEVKKSAVRRDCVTLLIGSLARHRDPISRVTQTHPRF